MKDAGSSLFGFGYGFGRTFAYAKQEAASAAGIVYPSESLPSAHLTDPPRCRPTRKAPHRVVQKRINIHPMCQMAFRQGFKDP